MVNVAFAWAGKCFLYHFLFTTSQYTKMFHTTFAYWPIFITFFETKHHIRKVYRNSVDYIYDTTYYVFIFRFQLTVFIILGLRSVSSCVACTTRPDSKTLMHCVVMFQFPDACSKFKVQKLSSSEDKFLGALLLQQPLHYSVRPFYQLLLSATVSNYIHIRYKHFLLLST